MCGLVVLTITLVSLGRSSDSIMAFLALFTAAAFRILPSANRVVTSVQALKFGKSQLDVILTDLNFENNATIRPPRSDESTTAAKINPSESLICFEEVSFRYQGSTDYVLNGITIEIKNGERVGIVGKSGSGKTTLISLMEIRSEFQLVLDADWQIHCSIRQAAPSSSETVALLVTT